MTSEELKKTLKGVYDSFTDEQKEKVKACKSAQELIAFAKEEGIELPDELLNDVAGGIQAGFFTQGGKGEFDVTKPVDTTAKPTWF